MGIRTASLTLLSAIAFACMLGAQASTTDRDRALMHYRLGIDHLRSEAWDQAVSAFKSAVEIDPSFEMGYYGLGRAYLGLRQFADAATVLVKCHDLYAA